MKKKHLLSYIYLPQISSPRELWNVLWRLPSVKRVWRNLIVLVFYLVLIFEHLTGVATILTTHYGVLRQRLLKDYFVSDKNSRFADVLQNRYSLKFIKFYRKTPMLEPLFNKLAYLQVYNFIKKRLQHWCFPVKIEKFLRTTLFIEHLRCLLKWIITSIKWSDTL